MNHVSTCAVLVCGPHVVAVRRRPCHRDAISCLGRHIFQTCCATERVERQSTEDVSHSTAVGNGAGGFWRTQLRIRQLVCSPFSTCRSERVGKQAHATYIGRGPGYQRGPRPRRRRREGGLPPPPRRPPPAARPRHAAAASPRAQPVQHLVQVDVLPLGHQLLQHPAHLLPREPHHRHVVDHLLDGHRRGARGAAAAAAAGPGGARAGAGGEGGGARSSPGAGRAAAARRRAGRRSAAAAGPGGEAGAGRRRSAGGCRR